MSHYSPPFRQAAIAAAALAALLAGCAAPPPALKAWRVEPNYRISNTGPSAAPGYVALAKQYEGERRWRDASEAWRKASLEAPADVEVLNALGTAEAGQGRYREAIAALRRAVALAPERAQFLNNLGFALMLDGLTAEAAAVFRDALARDPAHKLARANLERAEQSALANAPRPDEPARLAALGLGARTAQDATAASPTVPASTRPASASPATRSDSAAASTAASSVPSADSRVQTSANVAPLQMSIGYAALAPTSTSTPTSTPTPTPTPTSSPAPTATPPQMSIGYAAPTPTSTAAVPTPIEVRTAAPLPTSGSSYLVGFAPVARVDAPVAAAAAPAVAVPADAAVSVAPAASIAPSTPSAPNAPNAPAAPFAPAAATPPLAAESPRRPIVSPPVALTPAREPALAPPAAPLEKRLVTPPPAIASAPQAAATRVPTLARVSTLTLSADRSDLPRPSAAQPRIEIANGNGVTGMAARLSGYLRSRGALQHAALSNLAPFNAATSVVYYRPGFAAAAKALAERAPYRIEVAAAPGGPTGNADLRVVLGRDVRTASTCERNCVIAGTPDAAAPATGSPQLAALADLTDLAASSDTVVEAATSRQASASDAANPRTAGKRVLDNPPALDDDAAAPDRPSPLVAAWLAVLAR